MAKRHNITFDTEAQYNTFKASADYVEPNVSYIKETNGVEYNPYVDPYNGHAYVEIGGLKWATMNIGANSITDTGLYFQWGDTQGYTASQCGSGEGKKYFGWVDYKYATNVQQYNADMTKYNSTDGKIELDDEDDVAQAFWGGSWRMPTNDEVMTFKDSVNYAWTADYEGSGVAGLVLTSKADSNKKLFFPASGYCYNGSVNDVGRYGRYWSSSVNSSNVQNAYSLYFNSSNVYWQNSSYRHDGFAVRGVVG